MNTKQWKATFRAHDMAELQLIRGILLDCMDECESVRGCSEDDKK